MNVATIVMADKKAQGRSITCVDARRHRIIWQPADTADAVLCFASDRSPYVNGEELLLDGGYSKMPMSLIPRPGF